MKTQFYKLGWWVGENPRWCIIAPMVVSLILSTGFFNFALENDVEYLFTPTTGQSVIERREHAKYFTQNESTGFTASRKSTMGSFLR